MKPMLKEEGESLREAGSKVGLLGRKRVDTSNWRLKAARDFGVRCAGERFSMNAGGLCKASSDPDFEVVSQALDFTGRAVQCNELFC